MTDDLWREEERHRIGPACWVTVSFHGRPDREAIERLIQQYHTRLDCYQTRAELEELAHPTLVGLDTPST